MKHKKYKPICKFIFKGEPYTKSNAIIGKWNRKKHRVDITHRPYTIKYEKALKAYAMAWCKKKNVDPVAGPVRLKLTYYLKSRRIKDLQNLPKTTCDALEGSIYIDDTQIVEIQMVKRYDPKNPRVVIQADEILKEEYWEYYPLTERK